MRVRGGEEQEAVTRRRRLRYLLGAIVPGHRQQPASVKAVIDDVRVEPRLRSPGLRTRSCRRSRQTTIDHLGPLAIGRPEHRVDDLHDVIGADRDPRVRGLSFGGGVAALGKPVEAASLDVRRSGGRRGLDRRPGRDDPGRRSGGRGGRLCQRTLHVRHGTIRTTIRLLGHAPMRCRAGLEFAVRE